MNEKSYRLNETAFWGNYDVSPTEYWLELENPRTKVRVLEIGEGEPLLFVHGGPGAASIFAPIASHLQDYRCILLDRPGCGLSPAITYTQNTIDNTMVNIIDSCLDTLDLDRVTLIASSFGGACTFWFSQKYPYRVSQIVQLGCPAFVSTMQTPLIMRLLATPLIGYALARLPMNHDGVMSFMKTMGQDKAIAANKLSDGFVNWWISLMRDTDTMRNERELIRNGLSPRGMQTHLIIPDKAIQNLDIPTYFYWGVDDPFATTSFANNLTAKMKHAKIDFISDSGHLPWFDDPKKAATFTRNFLRETSMIVN